MADKQASPRSVGKRLAELEGMGWCLLGAFGLVALFPADQQWLGDVGLAVQNLLNVLFGVLDGLVPMGLVALGVARFRQVPFSSMRWVLGGFAGTLASLLLLLAGPWSSSHPGWVGRTLWGGLDPLIGHAGVVLVGGGGIIAGLYGMGIERWLVRKLRQGAEAAGSWVTQASPVLGAGEDQKKRPPSSLPTPRLTPLVGKAVGNGEREGAPSAGKTAPIAEALGAGSTGEKKEGRRRRHASESPPNTESENRRSTSRAVAAPPPGGPFQLPPLELLAVPPVEREGDRDAQDVGAALVAALKDFGIEVKLSGISPGPVITSFELEPAKGVKVSRIVGLADDLALSLKATAVRVVAPIPGKGAVGIEVPNREWELVHLRQILEVKGWQKSLILPLALGKAIDGSPVTMDLTQAPHMLIAGATGSGKSVCIQTILMSLLYAKSPDELQLILIDPKRVEFSLFRDLPHLMTPIVTDPRLASDTLKALIVEMESRYEKLSQAAAQNIAAYNRKVESSLRGASGTAAGLGPEHPASPLPYIVVCIDELAELMLIAAKEVEEAIMRLAQLARGVGIHLVVATQRPSVDVITGVIKANLPVRVAFQVASKVDSRTILDANGADALLGRGDMLYLPAGAPKPVRAQSCFVNKDEIEATVGFLNAQRAPQYQDLLAATRQKNEAVAESSEDPAVIHQALQFVKERKRVSTMLLQGALHISYGRAANLISWMEMKGMIGPGVGAKPRELYLDRIDAFLAASHKSAS